MATTNAQRVGRAMELVGEAFGPYVDRRLQAGVGPRWPDDVNPDGRPPSPGARDDVHFQLRAAIRFWRDGGFAEALGHSGRSWVSELLDARNSWAHNQPFTGDETYRVLDTAGLLLNAISSGGLAEELDRMRAELLRVRFAEEERRVHRRKGAQGVQSAPEAGLRPWREIVTPHEDVASGRYAQAEFAADLHQVWRGEATDEYGKAPEFFRRTFITEGLRDLLCKAARRLSADGGDPIVGLQTNFGGGKTHSLIALFHLAAGHPPATLPGVEEMLADAGLSPPPKAATAVLVGHRLAPASVDVKDDGTEVRTIWGEMAWQLGGREGYALVADADRTGTNPGDALVTLFRAHAPCLVLIDEWVAYARGLYGQEGLPGGSFDSQFSFAQALTDAAREVPGAMLVVSIPASDIEVGGEGGRQSLIRLENVVGRMETSWKPASVDEGFEIVRRRLFEPIPAAQERERDAVVHRFAELYRAQRGEFPSECSEGDYERRLRLSYPIHPELFDRLYGEWSTLERFQRTRGVLRLMASVVYELWRREDRGLLVLPGTLPIDASPVLAEMTNYLEEAWTPVITTDVDGENALPLRIDNDNPTLMRFSATRRVARTIFLGSAPVTEAANRGLDDRRIKLGCVQPGEAPSAFGDALRRLANQGLYLSTDGQRYWYGLQQTVTRLAADRAATYADDDADEEVRRRLRGISQFGDFARVHPAPASGTDVDDQPAACLVVVGPEHAHSSKVAESAARLLAAEILDVRAGGPRAHRNMLVFMAAESARVEELRDAARTFLAWESIDRDQESLNLDTVQRSQLRARRQEWDDAVNQRIGEAYQWLLIPAGRPGEAEVSWEAVRAGGSDPLALRASKRLRSDEALIVRYGGARLRLDLDRIPLWRGDDVSVADLWSFYTQYLYLPRLAAVEALLGAVEDGVANLNWAEDGFAYAEALDEGRYVGLRAAEQMSLVDATGLLVKPEVAQPLLDARKDQPPTGDPEGPEGGEGPPGEDDDEGSRQAKMRRFHGSVALDPSRMSREAGTIAQEVVAHLEGLVGANVEVRLEIAAEVRDGFPQNTIETVTENVGTLGFDGGAGFERE